LQLYKYAYFLNYQHGYIVIAVISYLTLNVGINTDAFEKVMSECYVPSSAFSIRYGRFRMIFVETIYVPTVINIICPMICISTVYMYNIMR